MADQDFGTRISAKTEAGSIKNTRIKLKIKYRMDLLIISDVASKNTVISERNDTIILHVSSSVSATHVPSCSK